MYIVYVPSHAITLFLYLQNIHFLYRFKEKVHILNNFTIKSVEILTRTNSNKKHKVLKVCLMFPNSII